MSHGTPTLEELFDSDVVIEGDRGVRPSAVVEDSRLVEAGALFIARTGTTDDGVQFIEDALARGADAILLGSDCELPPGCLPGATVRVQDPVVAGALAAHRFHGDPSSKLDVVAVTGTNGKTTVAWFVRALLAFAGRRCGMLGTIEVDDGVQRNPASLTTPSACELAAVLGRMVDNGCDSVVLEASSHALQQGRVHGIVPTRAIFTNLSGDHIDYHGSLEAYAAAKARLFEMLGSNCVAIVNGDDPRHERMLRDAAGSVLRCSTTGGTCDAEVRVREMDRSGSTLEFRGPWGVFTGRVSLVGRHNAENLLLAMATVHSMGVPHESIETALGTLVAPPGRLEPVTAIRDPFSVLVDYAHTDDALQNVLSAVRPLVGEAGRLTVVFGCGGDRDRSKRPRMARVACALADRVLVTSDNPRTEDPTKIVEEILAGVPSGCLASISSEVDRARAIRRALAEAVPGEIVLIAGKGHEDYQIHGTERRAFDDRLVARAALEAGISA